MEECDVNEKQGFFFAEKEFLFTQIVKEPLNLPALMQNQK